MRKNQASCSLSRARNMLREASSKTFYILAVREATQSGGNNMTLLEIIRDLESLDNEGIICARKPWTENSEAIVIVEPQARRLPAEAERLGMDYFLDVFIVREFLEDWTANLDAEPTLQQKWARVIKYAITDA